MLSLSCICRIKDVQDKKLKKTQFLKKIFVLIDIYGKIRRNPKAVRFGHYQKKLYRKL